ncbi:hypothetical protein F5Y16DRAFT_253655 [Xylariaceae sp. FL0255]|nr:hypothetical protein F5Y16DRAFT_253655 [Xylariaceae sp. FL0255]
MATWPGPPNVDDLWKTAVAKLNEHDRTTLDLNIDRLQAIEKSLELADEARRQCAEKAWRFKRKSGEEVVARDVLAKVSKWISHFKAVGDTIVQYDPAHAALPWAGVRFVLQVCIDYFDTHEFLLEKIPSIAEQICRCALIEKHLVRSPSPARDELKRALVKLYAAILIFLAQVKAYFQQSTRKQVLKGLESASVRFDQSFQAAVATQRDIDRCLQIFTSEQLVGLEDQLAQVQKPMARWSDDLATITDGLEKSRRTEILRWISTEPYLQHHKRERETFLGGTGEWLTSHPEFRKWKDESASSLLWLRGIPGSGKSKLTSLVIEDAINAFKSKQAPSPAYFYCSRNPAEPGRSDPEKILASIVRQLSSSERGKPLISPTIKTYEANEEEGFPTDGLQLQDSYDLLLKILDNYPTAMIVIDALDECDPRTRQALLDRLSGILRSSNTLVKIFVSSRNDQDIVYNLRDYPTLEISSDLNRNDIHRFVECETYRLIDQGKLLRSSQNQNVLRQKIVEVISAGAHDMFRWASLQLEALSDLVTDLAILERLGRLPPELKDLYQEILDKMQQQKAEADRVYTNNALAWLLCSHRRLNSTEFLAAVSTTDGLNESLSKDQVLELCRNLVVFDATLDSFRFAHLSVREFLENHPIYTTNTINAVAGRCCLVTLTSCYSTTGTGPLQAYANTFWAQHCQDAGKERDDSPLRPCMETFFSDTTPNSPFGGWNRSTDQEHIDWRSYRKIKQSKTGKACVLRVASVFNFVEVVRCQIELEENMNRLAAMTLLAATHGAMDSFEEFLGVNGMIVTIDIVQAAAGNEEYGEEMMALLLNKRGDQIEITADVVQAAAENYRSGKEVMALLLNKRGDQIEITADVVQAAAKNEECGEEVMALLLDKRGDQVEITADVVQAAAKNSRSGKEVMALLLDKRGDQVEISTQLICSLARDFDVRSMALLLDKRGDQIEITADVVQAAAGNEGSGKEVMSLLLKRRYESVLNHLNEAVGLAAAASGQIEILGLISCYNDLFERQAEWSIIANFYYAAKHGDLSQLQKLLSQVADPDQKNIRGVSPLSIAASSGHIEVVKCLVRRPDVNVNSMSISGRSPIFWPSAYGFADIVQELVAAGAVIDFMDTDGETAISVAKKYGHPDIVQILTHSSTRI